jgi:hypothetical protein
MTAAGIDGHLINWLGHAGGALVFGMFLALLLRDRSPGRNKALGAAGIAFLWNVAELVGLWLGSVGPYLAAFESTAFSFLPAILFDVVVGGAPVWAVRVGYGLSAAATAVHLAELVSDSEVLHGAGLYMVAAGFGVLAVYAAIRRRQRALPALALLLLSLSILHFAEDEQHTAWWVELLVHHAGVPLAMFVLLQDYRFVFLDALIRFLANILVALVFAGAAQAWMAKWPSTGLVGVAGLLILYAFARTRVQTLLTRLVFRREELSGFLDSLRGAGDEAVLLERAEEQLRLYFGAEVAAVSGEDVGEGPVLMGSGMEAGLGVKVSGGQIRVMRFGRRVGGRRYLSEDLQALRVAGERIREELERLREAGMQRLVAQAELRALQAQIHPHFLFNAFNTLYGIIPKEASGARRTVLNLADIFRYFLETDRTFVSVEDEVRIVRAYLEIEALRLGGKLSTELDVEPAVMGARIPLLSLEPLVENAVKHGVAARTEGGTVRLRVWRDGELLRVAVSDTGCGFGEKAATGGGVGLDNVRQRLRLCYGPEADLVIASSAAGATVSFAVPFPL